MIAKFVEEFEQDRIVGFKVDNAKSTLLFGLHATSQATVHEPILLDNAKSTSLL
jgi:hypothetical protein